MKSKRPPLDSYWTSPADPLMKGRDKVSKILNGCLIIQFFIHKTIDLNWLFGFFLSTTCKLCVVYLCYRIFQVQ